MRNRQLPIGGLLSLTHLTPLTPEDRKVLAISVVCSAIITFAGFWWVIVLLTFAVVVTMDLRLRRELRALVISYLYADEGEIDPRVLDGLGADGAGDDGAGKSPVFVMVLGLRETVAAEDAPPVPRHLGPPR